jgi:hypothetical protein
MGNAERPKAAWVQMMEQLPSAFDPAVARAQRSNEVLAPLPQHVPSQVPVDPWVESSDSPRQLAAQRAFDAHMAEIDALRRAQPEQKPPPPSPQEEFDPNSYVTFPRVP